MRGVSSVMFCAGIITMFGIFLEIVLGMANVYCLVTFQGEYKIALIHYQFETTHSSLEGRAFDDDFIFSRKRNSKKNQSYIILVFSKETAAKNMIILKFKKYKNCGYLTAIFIP